MKRKKIIGIGVLIAAVVAFGGYQYYASSEAEISAQAVETVAVQRMDIKSTVEAPGTIQPVDSVEVSS